VTEGDVAPSKATTGADAGSHDPGSSPGGPASGAPRPSPAAPVTGAPPASRAVAASRAAHGRPRRSGRGGGGLRGAVRRHPVRATLGAVVVVVVLVLGGGGLWLQIEADPGARGPQTIVTVSPGASVATVTATLGRTGVVGSTLAFRLYLVLHGAPVVQPGGYVLYRHESFAEVRARLAAGPDVFPVTVLAGFTVREVAQAVGSVPGHDGAHFLSLAMSGTLRSPYAPAGSTNLDGLLGTGTYIVVPGEPDATLLGDMIDRFDTVATRAGLAGGAAALGETPYEAVTVASIVQKEGVYKDNIGKVSRVVYNRLARGMRLQMDSTVLYSEGRDGGPVTGADETRDTPYNTYLHVGLTPTPICFPSVASLEAALAPTPGSWLYFVVVSKDGTEAFSDTLAGQEANEALAKSRGLG